MEPMVEEGICTFKVFLAYRGVLMVTDDLFFRVLEHARPRRDDDGPRENGWAIDVLVERARGRPDRPDLPRATPGRRRSRRATRGAVRFAELTGASVIVHVTCGLAADEIAAGQARGVAVPARPACST